MMTIWIKGWVKPDLTTAFRCDVNIKSIHEKEFYNKCVGSFMN